MSPERTVLPFAFTRLKVRSAFHGVGDGKRTQLRNCKSCRTQPIRRRGLALTTSEGTSVYALDLGSGLIKPRYEGGGEADRGQIISRQPVVTGCDAPEVLQPIEGTFDAPAQLAEALAEGERLFPVAAVWNDRIGSALIQLLAQFGAIVSLVANHAFRWLHPADQALRDRAIMRFAARQQDGERRPLASASA
jgi:hypothetical protein